MSAADVSFARELIAYWISFVRSGDPNTFKLEKSPSWTAFTTNSSRIVLQKDASGSTTGSGSFVEPEAAEERSRCELVASLVGQQENQRKVLLNVVF
jgi:hypothetical protein